MRKIIFIIAALLTLSVGFAQLRSLAPASVQCFLEERGLIERLTRENRTVALSMVEPVYVAPQVINGYEMVDAFIDIDNSGVLPVLKSHGVLVNCEFDGFVTAQVPVDRLTEISRLPGVVDVEVSKRVQFCTDSTLSVTHAGQVLNGTEYGLPQAYDGSGVIVGIIDGGFDYRHSAFRTTDSIPRSRIVRVYDVTSENGHPAMSEGNAMPGSVFMNEQIDSLVSDGIGTHGTHVASIAAGTHVNGYGGMAPGADIVLCVSPSLNAGTSEVEVVNCIKYINSYADSVGKPCVVSISVSVPNGPHDGSDRISRAVAEITGPGHIFVIAAGNTAGRSLYSHGPVTMDKPMYLPFIYNHMDIPCDGSYYYPNFWTESWVRSSGTRIVAALHIFDKETRRIVWESPKTGLLEVVDLNEIEPYFVPDLSVDSTAYLRLLVAQTPASKYSITASVHNLKSNSAYWDQSKGSYISRYELGLSIYAPKTLYPRQPDSCYVDNWVCTIQSGRFSYDTGAYVDREEGDSIVSEYIPDFFIPSNSYASIGTYAVHDSVISAGGYVGRNSYYSDLVGTLVYADAEVGGLYSVSSYELEGYGPTGKALPTVVAPAYLVVSAVSRYSYFQNDWKGLVRRDPDGSLWGVLSGTSMAAPTVAGIIAQWLQLKPDLCPSQVKDIIAHTAVKDAFYGKRFGPNGKIDAMAGIRYLQSLMPAEIEPGDVDGNGTVDIDDVTMMIDLILGRPSPDILLDAADYDGSGLIDIDDVTAMIHFILIGVKP